MNFVAVAIVSAIVLGHPFNKRLQNYCLSVQPGSAQRGGNRLSEVSHASVRYWTVWIDKGWDYALHIKTISLPV